MNKECCDKCYSNYTSHDWPAHTTHDACLDPGCPCHQPQVEVKCCSNCRSYTKYGDPSSKAYSSKAYYWYRKPACLSHQPQEELKEWHDDMTAVDSTPTPYMNKKEVKIEEAKEAWEKVKDNEFTLIFYPTFDDYWKECERINNLPDDEWYKLIEENQKKLKDLTPPHI